MMSMLTCVTQHYQEQEVGGALVVSDQVSFSCKNKARVCVCV